MFENLFRVLRPLRTFKGREYAAVGDDPDDQKHNHDRAERGLHL